MDTNANCQFILKRINGQDTITLDKPNYAYTCGRSKENEIVCLSMVVSRQHCIFFHRKDGLFVADLMSANGLFINGVAQQPHQVVQLHSNDIVGVGCSGIDITDKTMFAYKLHTIAQSQTLESNNASTLSETVLNSENTLTRCTSIDRSDPLVKRKREERNCDVVIVPNKIPKLEDESHLMKEPVEEKCVIMDENDIEIIHDSLKNSLSKQNNENCEEVHVNSMTLVSPLKLKKVQQVPTTKFSEDDVVNLSDSEDDIFPSSQLFDSGFGVNTSVKQEIKDECAETDSERYNRLHDEDLVISLTDSEDEGNNWLCRLSRSQILNEDDEIITKIKEDYNAKEDKTEIESTDIENLVYDLNEAVDELQPDVGTKGKPENKIKKSVYRKGKETSLQNVRNTSQTYLSSSCTKRVEIDFKENSTEFFNNRTISNKKHSESWRNQSKQQTQKVDTSFSSTIETSITLKKKESLEKKVPQIEPPHLSTKRRSSGANKVQESLEKPVKQRLTTKEKKELKEKSKIEQYALAKERKNRRILHKWADCLPPNKIKASTPLTKEEKKKLVDNRKQKLKTIAMEEKRLSLENNQEKKRTTVKPKAKMSVKTRSDFLVEDTISVSKLPISEKSKTSSNQTPLINHSRKKKNTVEGLTTDLQHSLTLVELNKVGKIPKMNNAIKAGKTSESTLLAIPMQKVMDTDTTGTKLGNVSNTKSTVSTPNKSLAPCTSNTELRNKKKTKRVSFSTVIQTVREYQIDELNVLKKLKGKDAPLPRIKAFRATENERTHEFLLRIFLWNPVWLEEQEYLNTTPPVVNGNELYVMLTHYKSYDEYCRIISPLLLLETWYGITKEFQNIDQDPRRPTLMCSIVENSIQRDMKSTNIYLTTLMIEVLATKQDIERQAHPVFGDLVFFEYIDNQEKRKTFHKVFAYVTDVHQTILTPWTHYNRDLGHYVKNPCSLLTYTMTTKPLNQNIVVNRVQRLRTVTYLRSTLRMVRALDCLPKSQLMDPILSPKIEMYQLPTVSASETLITQDKLNQKQLEAVFKITETIVQKQAKLCFIQGPPGTGKSKVIVNIVTQVLYGSNRYTNNGSPLKILVCAPSNAAIDEITMRLLQIRSTMKHVHSKGFKMVRIGRAGAIHPIVKDISVTELAKREVKRTTTNTNNIPLDSVDEEKSFLESKINALKCELANTQKMDEVYRQHVRMKLTDITAKYELLLHRRPLKEINPKELVKIQRAAENRVLAHADIITCTLSSCYNNQMESVFVSDKHKISVCIVDEASQSCEAETLIPLMLRVNTLVLVGDSNQLPATILSPQAKQFGLDQSIFSRVQNAFEFYPSNPIIGLDMQYRMQHEICSWPNKFFYGGKLKTAVARNESFPFQTYRILNINANQNNDNSSNTDEAQFVTNMIASMLIFANFDKWECISIGIITPYNNQKSILQKKIAERMALLSENIKKKIKLDVNTVDGFQGQERDVIIMSCVRSRGIGFLSDRQRLCVALTRAKHSLILCGNFNTFMRDPMWNSLLSDAKFRKIFFNVNANAEPQEIKVHVVKRF
ncbi:uncharacterized protein LOC143152358 isoform X1 [Ptiloglossa arizonensis]|uniref:uncharacterized protein LOC143152358 isoform X1 n=1 Tax=Ptiloglossa arizonensis TaxID=3350558 RepID=UPI003FA14ED1